MNSGDRLMLLIDRYLDGQLSPEEKQELAAELRTRPEARRRLLEQANWHAALVHWGSQQQGAQQSKRDFLRTFFRAAGSASHAHPGGGRGWPLSPSFALAASIAILVAGLFATLLQHSDPLRSVAKVTFDRQTEWAIARRPDNRGNLRPGDYQLNAGILRFETSARAVVTVAAPAKFRIVDAENITLSEGKLLARMLGERSSLTVLTRAMSVVDLGTIFGVKADAAGREVVSVFDGKVAVRDMRGGREPQFLTEGSSVVAWQDDLSLLGHEKFDHMNFADLWPFTAGVNDFSNAVQFVRPGPQRDPWRDHRSQTSIFLLPEKYRIASGDTLRVDLPGRTEVRKTDAGYQFQNPGAVNSYLLFYNPPRGAAGRTFSISGSVTFSHPIAGVITSEAGLEASDRLCGYPDVEYAASDDSRAAPPRSGEQETRDLVRVSEDGRSVYFQLNVGSARKRLRVLVSAL